MHTPRRRAMPASLYSQIQVPVVPGRGARGSTFEPRALPNDGPKRPPWRSQGQGPGGKHPMGTYQRAAGYVLANVGKEDPLREVKAHARAIAAEGLVQVHAAAGRRSLLRLRFTPRQASRLLRAARRHPEEVTHHGAE